MEERTWKINWLCVATCCVALAFLLPHSLNEYIRYDALSSYAAVFGGKVRGNWFVLPMALFLSICVYALRRGFKKPHFGEWIGFIFVAVIAIWFQFEFAKDWREYSLRPFSSRYERNALVSWSKESREQFFAHPHGDAISGVDQALSDTKGHKTEEALVAIICALLLVFGIIVGLKQILPEFVQIFRHKLSPKMRWLVGVPIVGLLLTGLWLSIFYTAANRMMEGGTLCYIARKTADLDILKDAAKAGIKINRESFAIKISNFVLFGKFDFPDTSCRELLRDTDLHTKGKLCPEYLDPWMKCSCGSKKFPEDNICQKVVRCQKEQLVCSQY